MHSDFFLLSWYLKISKFTTPYGVFNFCLQAERRKEKYDMRIEGIYKNNGKTTIYISQEPDSYYVNSSEGRTFQGRMAKAIYLGDYDVTGLKVGNEIDIYYGEPMTTKSGTYAPIKKIEILK